MTRGHQFSALELLLAEVTSAGVAGHVGHVFAGVPSWLSGAVGGLVVGAVLRLLDPTLRAHGERLRARLTPVPLALALTRSVLVVDDHASVRTSLAMVLRDALDVTVHEAATGADARSLFDAHRPAAVVCDLVLPDELGADVLASLPRRVGAVLTSGVADAEALEAAAARCGAVAMRKPIGAAAIVAAVRDALDA